MTLKTHVGKKDSHAKNEHFEPRKKEIKNQLTLKKKLIR